jgi:hypothetical protein
MIFFCHVIHNPTTFKVALVVRAVLEAVLPFLKKQRL